MAYANGDGCKQDSQKAFTLLKKAAEKGYSPAQRVVGVYYLDGVGTVVDKRRASCGSKKLQSKMMHALFGI